MGQTFQTPTQRQDTSLPAVEAPIPRAIPVAEDFGSNQDRMAQLGLATPAAPVQAPVLAPTPAQAPAPAPAGLDRKAVSRVLRKGKDGEDVKALQRFVGIEGDAVDGDYGGGTAKKVAEWQAAHGLEATGSVGPQTIAAMRGDEYIYGYSMSHDPDKFVPKYPMTAYHESGIYRKNDDPYAVGAITHPNKEQDFGGKTYGPYQFESFHYADGTKDEKSAPSSTLQRFINWKDNPYSARLQETVGKGGVASGDFDKLWGELASGENKAFGEAQQAFLEHDVADRVSKLMDTAGASAEARKDPRLVDLMMGTVNQYFGLAGSHIGAAAEAQKAAGKPLSADQIALAIQDHKAANVETNFKKSPDAWEGVRGRIADERKVFEKK